jgi:hypothetical protein
MELPQGAFTVFENGVAQSAPSINALDGSYRTISLKIEDESKLMVRTRAGYFRPEAEHQDHR